MAEHTPGPWTLREGLIRPASPFCRIVQGDRASLAFVNIWQDEPSITSEAEANARLIAAAPDLLAGCKAALPKLSEADDYAKKLIESAISKAEGR